VAHEPIGVNRVNFLIRLALSHSGLSTCIIGAKSVEHLTENARAASAGKLADDVVLEAKRRLDAIGVVAQ
jgi:aryl-alcohol dehydrogenase-like predicted oxidoreductase